jgi:Flp pilus assembly protein TadG
MGGDAEVRGGLRTSASRTRTQRGAATAEAMVVLPVLVAVGLGLVWAITLVVTQVRVVDGAREAARAAARGEPDSVVRAAARRVAPDGATVDVRGGSGLVTAVVTARVAGPGGLFRLLPEVTVRSTAAAVPEPT